MTEIDRIVDELTRVYDGEPWHGSPVRSLLEGVDFAAAAARPIAGAHTIWELVLHLTAWTAEARRRVEGGEPAVPAEGDWPPMPEDLGASAWSAALAKLDASHRDLLRAVRSFPEQRVDEEVGRRRDRAAGTGVSYAVLLHGVSQHDAYHSGQVAILRKALGHRFG
ncbi:MAG: DinB family protein [Candidatus Eisenbacteria bacterium]